MNQFANDGIELLLIPGSVGVVKLSGGIYQLATYTNQRGGMFSQGSTDGYVTLSVDECFCDLEARYAGLPVRDLITRTLVKGDEILRNCVYNFVDSNFELITQETRNSVSQAHWQMFSRLFPD